MKLEKDKAETERGKQGEDPQRAVIATAPIAEVATAPGVANLQLNILKT